MLDIEVAYATTDEQVIVALTLTDGATVSQAIHASHLLERFPEIDGKTIKAGIFGEACPLERTLCAGDRVEIYRPLLNDPKEARKHRASKKEK